MVEQVGAGTNEGIAGMLGLPVDMLTGSVNRSLGKINERAREHGKPEIPPVTGAFGGSESIKGALDPFITDADPQSAGQRIGRRVGQDVGAGAVAGPLAGVGSLGGMALNAGSDVASGVVGGLTSEKTKNPTINAITSILAGMAPVGASRA
jgi:hypothetical protein